MSVRSTVIHTCCRHADYLIGTHGAPWAIGGTLRGEVAVTIALFLVDFPFMLIFNINFGFLTSFRETRF